MALPRGMRLAFCRTCAARDRAIMHGVCQVCGHRPDEAPEREQ